MYFLFQKFQIIIIFDKLPNYSEFITKRVKIAANFAVKYNKKFCPCIGTIKVPKMLIKLERIRKIYLVNMCARIDILKLYFSCSS